MDLNIGVPNSKQELFLEDEHRYVGYGGARGGGKSWVVRSKSTILAFRYPGIRILIVRRTYPQLYNNHIVPFNKLFAGMKFVKYNKTDKVYTFTNGSTINFGYLANDGDMDNYQGPEYDVIFLDEGTQIPEHHFLAINACVRGVNDFPKRTYVTCNPGGVGHNWVKRLFVDKKYKDNEKAENYSFIQALVYDNNVLLDTNPDYLSALEALPAKKREAWLHGSWDVFEGQYFTMWDDDIHVMKPFAIPKAWAKYVSFDYGRDMFACYFIAVDSYGRAYVYDEIYASGLIVSEAAELLKQVQGSTNIDTYFAPPDLWNKHSDSGRSTAEIFADYDIYLLKANNQRVQGLYDLAEWLKVFKDEQDKPCAMLRVFDNCKNLIRCISEIQYDDKNNNDVANEPHELTHSVDAIRYFVAGRAMPAIEDSNDDYDELEAFDSYF